MSYLVLRKTLTPAPPGTGEVVVYVDVEDGHIKQMDENGLILDLLIPPRAEFSRELGLLNNPVGAGTLESISLTAGAQPHDVVTLLFGARCTDATPPAIGDDKGNTWQVDVIHKDGDNNLAFIASTGQDVGTLAEADSIQITFPTAPQASRFGWVESFKGLDTSATRVHRTSAADWSTSDVADTGTTTPTTISRAIAVSLFVSGATGYQVDLNATGTEGKYLPFPGGANLEPYGDFDKVGAAGYQSLSSVGAQRHVGHVGGGGFENGSGVLVVYAAEVV